MFENWRVCDEKRILVLNENCDRKAGAAEVKPIFHNHEFWRAFQLSFDHAVCYFSNVVKIWHA